MVLLLRRGVTATTTVAGTYTVTAVASNGCTASATNLVTIYPSPSGSIPAVTPVCQTETINLLSGTWTNASGATYKWTGPNSFTANTQNASISNASLTAAGTYTLTVTSANGCTSTATVAVVVNPCLSKIGDFVWEDTNGNGIQDSGELGIPGVSVTLNGTDAFGNTVTKNVTTGPNGEYLFDNLVKGTYVVTFGDKAGYTLTSPNKGLDDQDSDADLTTKKSPSITLGTNDTNLTIDAGMYRPASLGDFVWYDWNNNGIQDSGENGIPNVTATLNGTKGDGTVISPLTATTNASGIYAFTNLAPGTYTVTFGTVSGFQVTKQDVTGANTDATDVNTDSDINSTTLTTHAATLVSGENDPKLDAGFTKVADLELVKTVSNGTPNVGDVVTFSIKVDNKGPQAATNVKVEDVVPNGYEAIAAISDGGVNTSGTINWTVASIANGGSKTLTFTAKVKAPVSGITYSNIAKIKSVDQYDPDSDPTNAPDKDGDGKIGSVDSNPNDSGIDPQDEDDADDEPVSPQVADLELVKTVSNGTPNVGDVVTFSIKVDNKGPQAATNVKVEDVVPNGYEAIAAISDGGVNTSGTINWTVASIANGGSKTLTFTAKVKAPVSGIIYSNIAKIKSVDQYDPDSDPTNAPDKDGDGKIGSVDSNPNDSGIDPQDEDDADDEPVSPQVADLELVKLVSNGTPNVGDVVTFSIKVDNKGPQAATNVKVEDVVPNGYEAIAAISDGGVNTSGTINWTVASIANGGSKTLTFTAKVKAPVSGITYSNIAKIKSVDQYDPDSDPTNAPDKDGDGKIGSVDSNPNDSGIDPQDEDDADDEPVSPQVADLELVKLVSNGTPNVGDVVTFSIKVDNKGPQAATNDQTKVEDVVPNGYEAIAAISDGGVNTSGTINWTVASIANGGSKTLTFTAKVKAPVSGITYSNIAKIKSVDQYDPDSDPTNAPDKDGDGKIGSVDSNPNDSGIDPQDEDDADDEPVSPQVADLELVKLVSNGTPNVGDVVTFSIKVDNKGPQAATNVKVEDVVPNGYEAIAAISDGGVNTSGTINWTVASIANGGSKTLTFTAKVKAPVSGITYSNIAKIKSVDQYDPDSDPTNAPDKDGDGKIGSVDSNPNDSGIDPQDEDDADDEPVSPQVADLELVKTVSNGTPNVGDVVTFTIKVDNKGPQAATNVKVEDVVPNGYEAIAAISDGGVNTSGTINWTVASIANGGSKTLTFTAKVKAPVSGITYSNIAKIKSVDQYDPDSDPTNAPDKDGDGKIGSVDSNPNDSGIDPQDEDDADDEPVSPQVADLELVKTVSNGTPNVGDVVTFSIKVDNKGPQAATNVKVEDVVPNGYEAIAAISDGGVNTSGTINWTVASISNGGSKTLTFTAKVKAPVSGITYSNIAKIKSVDQYDPDSDPTNAPDKDGDGKIGSVDSNPNDSGIDPQDEDDADDEPVSPQVADLELVKTVSNGTPNVGDVVTFSIKVDNKGPQAATNVKVEDVVPNGYEAIAAISDGGINTSGTINWTVASIANGGSKTLTFTAKVKAPVSGITYSNIAKIKSVDQYDPDSDPTNAPDKDGDGKIGSVDSNPNDSGIDPQDEDDADDEPVSPQVADLELVKTVSNGTPNVGDVVTFSIKVDNKGPQAATNVKVEDVVPNGYEAIAAISDGGVNTSGTINWTVASIANGGSKTLTFTAKVKAPVSGITYSNIAKIKSVDQYDPDSDPTNAPDKDGDGKIGSVDSNPNDSGIDPQDEDDADDEPVSPQVADLELVKTVSNGTPNVGDVVTFSIKVDNKGPQAATNVKVEDVVPNGYEAIAAISDGGVNTSGTINWTVASIANGGSKTLTFTAKVKAPVSGITYSNIAKIKSVDQYDPDSDPTNAPDKDGDGKIGSVDSNPNDSGIDPQDEDDADDEPVSPQVADLELVKLVSNGTPNVGDVVTFSIKVDNKGPQAATNVKVEDVVPNGYEAIAAISDGGVNTSGTINWTVASIANGGSKTLTFTAKVKAPVSGITYSNIAKIKSVDQYDPDSDPTNAPDKDGDGKIGSVDSNPNDSGIDPQDEDDADDEPVSPQVADLELVKLVSNGTPNVGDVVTFSIKVDNKGPQAATNVKVEDVVPNGYEAIAAISDGGVNTSGTINWTVASIANGGSKTLTFTAKVKAPVSGITYSNIAKIKSVDQYDPDSDPTNAPDKDGDGKIGSVDSNPNDSGIDPQDEDDADDEPVSPQVADLSLVKTVSDKYPKVGDNVTFTVKVSNTGPQTATSVLVEDLVPNGYSAISGISNSGTATGNTVNWTIPSITSGSSINLTFIAKVGQPASGVTFINLAQVKSVDQYDPDSNPGNGADTNGNGKVGSEDNDDSKDPADEDDGDDAYVIPTAKLGNLVWSDINGNGLQDSGEPGIPGVTVKLNGTDQDGNVVSLTTVTDANGNYLFDDLVPGNYTVTFPLTAVIGTKTGKLTDEDNTGATTDATDVDTDSDPNETTGITETYTLSSGEVENKVDAGYYIPASISNFVWEDTNGNGKQDSGEPGIAGVPVSLTGTTGDGTPVTLTTTTDATGNYIFDNLEPGTYTVKFGDKVGYENVEPNQGADDTIDSDADKTTGNAPAETLESGEDNTTIDAGYYKPASIGNYVWLDKDADGIQDATELGIQGVTVTLTGTTGDGNTVTLTDVTDANGLYLFENLEPGTYTVTVSKPAGYEFSQNDLGGNDATDSDSNPTTGVMPAETLTSGENNLTYDAGVFELGSISNFVWEDTNGNGKQDSGEPGIAGVPVSLTGTTGDGTPVTLTTTTDATGNYIFDNLEPGTYTVKFGDKVGYENVEPNQGTDDTIDSDADKTTSNAPAETLESGEDNTTIDAGYYKPASIGNYVWLDKDADGVQDATEAGIAGVTVTLTGTTGDGDAVTLTDVTDANGLYLFENLEPGTYTVTVSKPAGYEFSQNDLGGNDATDSDSNPTTGVMPAETLTSGENNLTFDAGVFELGSISNFVWEDTNGNGKQDSGEPGIAGVPVSLTGTTGDGTPVTLTTTTDATGNYIFDNLEPGTYTVKFGDKVGYENVEPNQGTDDTIDSDADKTTGNAPAETLESGEDNTTIDAGYYKPASIGNYVWLDKDADGIQDATELGIQGVTVTLTGTTGDGNTVTLTDVTDANGLYLFENLEPGTYTVTVSKPAGYEFSQNDLGGNDATDSDSNPTTGVMPAETLTSGENNLTFDAGVFELGSISNFVWEDTNGNGKQDLGEPGIAGVPVSLTGTTGDGTPVTLTTTTDATGNYIFDNLEPGTYTVKFGDKVGYENVEPNQGTDDTIDSDADKTTGNAPAETLESGEDNTTIDAGYYKPASIGNYVWLDKDADGIQDATELGIQGVTVTLTGTTGDGNTVTLTDVTDANGLYLFENLEPGTYTVTVSKPAGYEFSQNDLGGNDATDSDSNPTTGVMPAEVLTSGENNLTYDAGVFELGSISNFVWEDTNGNGKQDSGEPGIAGVPVSLTGTTGDGTPVTLTTTTDATGNYIFDNLEPGTYTVKFGDKVGYENVEPNQGADDTIDSDADKTTGNAPAETLESGEDNTTIDAGYYKPASIGNYVWLDKDADGIQDATELGIQGVTVTLTGTTGDGNTVTLTDVTDANGLYLFENLEPGTYTVTVSKPAGYEFSQNDLGGNDATDSDSNPTTGVMPAETLTSGENNLTYDAGVFELGSISNYVWEDTNGNGKQDLGEPGIAGVPVSLTGTTGDGTPVTLTTTTDATGNYIFDNLEPGTYTVKFGDKVGYENVEPNQGTDDTIDSDADKTTGNAPAETLESGEDNTTIDAGYYKPASIGNYVWLDKDADGIQDATETGIQGVTVTLTGTTGDGNTVTLTDVTDANGLYLFENLEPGTYTVTVSKPAGYEFSQNDLGGNDATDSDSNPTTGVMPAEVLTSGENNLTYDAGVFELGSISNYVWEDTNGNGKQDLGEPGIAGVPVSLTGTTGDGTPVTLTTTTDATGNYIFDNLEPGTYTVKFGDKVGYENVEPNQGTDDTIDSDADKTTGNAPAETLESGEDNTTIDAGYYKPASIGNYVWLDKDADGIQDATETGIQGVTVTLTGTTGDGNTVTLTDVTDANGLYLFENLEPGTYTVTVSKPAGYEFSQNDLGGNDATDSDSNPTTGVMPAEVLTSGENNLTYDAGVFELGSISNYVWEDTNGNGKQDLGEPGIAGVPVSLTGTTGDGTPVTLTTTTDATGNYIFDNLEPGTYTVKFGDKVGYENVEPNQGTDDTIDSDADKTTGNAPAETLESGEDNTTIDAGYYKPASIGNYVWLDKDADGIQDATETGIQGVTVTLTGTTGDGNTVTLTDVTDANGLYLFENLEPGTYTVTVSKPAGYEFSQNDLGGNDATDSDSNPTTGVMPAEVLTSGENNLTYDAGVFELGSISNYVWEDTNGNGKQDLGEPGIAGVPVSLTGTTGDGTPVTLTTTTDATGNYIFDNLEPGTYTVKFGDKVGYENVEPNQGTDDTIDSDADKTTGNAPAETLESGEDNTTIDAGYYKPASIGNYVWLDKDADGIQDATETGIQGVTVTLTGTTGDGNTVTLTDVTDANGLYLFENLEPGTYTVTVSKPAGYEFSQNDLGGNDATDSDSNPTTGVMPAEVLTSGENNLTYDAGVFELGSISNYVWEDTNGNGKQDLGEPGIAGVPVSLTGTTGDGTPVTLTTTTDATGNYIFDNLEPGTYTVKFGDKVGYENVEPNQGTDDTIDSDADKTTGNAPAETLESGEDNTTIDAGYYKPASIGNYVWLDKDADGIQDATETGIQGVTVTLTGTTGDGNTVTLTDVTDANGLYLFENLEPGTYTVTVSKPAGYEFSQNDLGGNDATDSDSNPTTGVMPAEVLTSGENNLTYDAGVFELGSISNYVWEDTNGNGKQDLGEPGIAGVPVSLTGTTGDGTPVTLTTTTDATGNYIFDNLEPGTYTVKFGDKVGYENVEPNQGTDDTIDSDADKTTGNAPAETLERWRRQYNDRCRILQTSKYRKLRMVRQRCRRHPRCNRNRYPRRNSNLDWNDR